MQAQVGDELVIEGHKVGETVRTGEVLEVRGDDGGPPYLVRWDDSGRSTLLFPGSDCVVKHLADREEAL
jgi:Domain of unknown function (DUF1918)